MQRGNPVTDDSASAIRTGRRLAATQLQRSPQGQTAAEEDSQKAGPGKCYTSADPAGMFAPVPCGADAH